MAEITEIFILKLKDPTHAEPIRARAKQDFLTIEGVTAWQTLVTMNPDKPPLVAEIFRYPDRATADRITPQFRTRPSTRAYLEEIEDILVGQYFVAKD